MPGEGKHITMEETLKTVDDLERAELLVSGVHDILSIATAGMTREGCAVIQHALTDALGCLEDPLRAAHDALRDAKAKAATAR